MRRVVLPFSAIVGQPQLKEALLLNAVNPGLLGVLIRGEKGTGKSTAVRALADLLPEIEVVTCPYNCSPTNPSLQCRSCSEAHARGERLPTVRRNVRVVELPLGATEDRVIGTLNLERALKEGIKALDPGILAEVNQGILYIDEVNLLDDHLVDVLLDAAAMGVNTVEREGISVSHPSKFILVGTMNPEEGEIRPQLLDRFGLSVEVVGTKDPLERIQIIKVVEEFERDPSSFVSRFSAEQEELRARIAASRDKLDKVRISDGLLETIVRICLAFEVQGHRADLLMARAAVTRAAFDGRRSATKVDLQHAAELVLPHRTRRMPFEEPKPVGQLVATILDETGGADPGEETAVEARAARDPSEGHGHEDPADGKGNPAVEPADLGGSGAPELKARQDRKLRTGSGRRARSLSTHSGKYVTSRMPGDRPSDIAIDATLRAVAARKGELAVEKEDLREKVRAKKVSSVVVFVVDASGSMGAMKGMDLAKGAVLRLLEDSYQKRDKVGFIVVAGDAAQLVLPPTRSIEQAVKCLRQLPTEGKTPLPDGLLKGLRVLQTELWKNKHVVPIMVVVSDGRGNVPLRGDPKKEALSLARKIGDLGIDLVVIDCDDGFLDLGMSRELSEAGRGLYYSLAALDEDGIVDVVRGLAAPGESAAAND